MTVPAPYSPLGITPSKPPYSKRMVLDLDRKALLARDEARAFRHGPALQDPVQLEAEIIVKPAGGMLLDDIGIAGLRFASPAWRLRRLREVPLRFVRVELLVHGAGRCHWRSGWARVG